MAIKVDLRLAGQKSGLKTERPQAHLDTATIFPPSPQPSPPRRGRGSISVPHSSGKRFPPLPFGRGASGHCHHLPLPFRRGEGRGEGFLTFSVAVSPWTTLMLAHLDIATISLSPSDRAL